MGTLDETNALPVHASRSITIDLPKSNPNIQTQINTELDLGWHLVTSVYDSSRDEIRVFFVRPKKRAD
jgi:hypothetical protein